MQANQPENYNIQMNEGEVGRLNAMIDQYAFSTGTFTAFIFGPRVRTPTNPNGSDFADPSQQVCQDVGSS